MTKHRIQLISSQNVLEIHLNSVTLCKGDRHFKLQKKMTKGFQWQITRVHTDGGSSEDTSVHSSAGRSTSEF